jgi:hypothetical protein
MVSYLSTIMSYCRHYGELVKELSWASLDTTPTFTWTDWGNERKEAASQGEPRLLVTCTIVTSVQRTALPKLDDTATGPTY